MTDLQKEFEATGYTSWINANLYPDGKIYTQEYTQWLERQVMALRRPWTPVTQRLPEPLQTVWMTNGSGWVALGCLAPDGTWAESNGIIYAEDGRIVAECESDDFDVTMWAPVPDLPK